MKISHLIGVVSLLVVLASGPVFASKQLVSPCGAVDEILVQYESWVQELELDVLCTRLSQEGFAYSRLYPRSRVFKLQMPLDKDLASAISELQSIPGVRRAERVFECSACGYPNDERYYLQWNLPRIDYEEAWDAYLSSISLVDPAIIAVLDTGVAYENYQDANYTYEKAPDFDQLQFVQGYDTYNDDSHPNDDNGHGTHTCAVLGQSTNNMTGIASMAFACKIMPVKVLGEYQVGDTASVTEGIYYAVDHGADVLNLSLGFSWYFSHSDILAEAVTYAATSGVVVIASSGNKDRPFVKFPAAYNECLAVGACLPDNYLGNPVRASYSNYGVAIDVVAPGGDYQDRDSDGNPEAILGVSFDGGAPSGCWDLWWASGTSPATAHVSGIAGLLVSLGYDREDVLSIIKGTASKVSFDPLSGQITSIDDFDCYTGYGIVNLNSALQCALGNLVPEFAQYNTSVDVSTVEEGGGMCHGLASIEVTLADGYTPAIGVAVYGYWTGDAKGADSDVTDSNGECTFSSESTDELNPEFDFVVTNVVPEGAEFTPTGTFDPSNFAIGDGMIVRPLRSTDGDNCAYAIFTPWFNSDDLGIY